MSETKQGIFSCKGVCWITGAMLGIVAFLILKIRMDLNFVLALIIALVVLIAAALILRRVFCLEYAESESVTAAREATQARAEEMRKASETRATNRDAARREAAESKATAAAVAAPVAEAPKAAAPATPPAAEDGKPETLSAPRGGKADDLKRISGVGPALEKTLNELGFYHFDQIAAWGGQEVEWVDSRLKFKGRIERDDWIKQAGELAKGN